MVKMAPSGSHLSVVPFCVQELFRRVRSILNKLTPQKFNQLMKQVTDLTIDTEERLKGVIDLVFEKAIDEPGFSVAYGNMCRCLATVRSHSAGVGTAEQVSLPRLSLNVCPFLSRSLPAESADDGQTQLHCEFPQAAAKSLPEGV